MRALLFFILLSVWSCSFIVQAQAQPQPQPQPQPQAQQPQLQKPEKKQNTQPQTKKGFVKSIFNTSLGTENKNKKEKTNKHLKVLKEKIVDVDQLQEIIDDLPAKDKRIITSVKVQISTWPKEVFDEISEYREFVISSRKVAKQKYELLSPEAKTALETEKQLKARLSPETANILESLEVKSSE